MKETGYNPNLKGARFWFRVWFKIYPIILKAIIIPFNRFKRFLKSNQ